MRTDAAAASLLLTFEGAATALIAWFIFHENFDRRVALGMLCLLAGVAVLSWSGAPALDSFVGPLAIIGACISWGIDNNLTRKVFLRSPLQIVTLKGLILDRSTSRSASLWAPRCQLSYRNHGRRRWVFRVRRKPRFVCGRFAVVGSGPYGRLFFHRTIYRQRGCGDRARRADNCAAERWRSPDGAGRLATSHRAP